MKQEFTRELARQYQRELDRCIDKLGDEFTFAEFQQLVYRKHGLVIQPNKEETKLTLHKPFAKMKEHEQFFRGNIWGLTGPFIRTSVLSVKFNGHYDSKMLNSVKRAVSNKKLNNN